MLHVTGDGLDVGSGVVVVRVVDDLVTGEEGEGVVVLGERYRWWRRCTGGRRRCRRCAGLGTVEGVLGSVDIEDQVDAGIGEGVHALVVVLGVVDRVDTDGVHAEVLEVL